MNLRLHSLATVAAILVSTLGVADKCDKGAVAPDPYNPPSDSTPYDAYLVARWDHAGGIATIRWSVGSTYHGPIEYTPSPWKSNTFVWRPRDGQLGFRVSDPESGPRGLGNKHCEIWIAGILVSVNDDSGLGVNCWWKRTVRLK